MSSSVRSGCMRRSAIGNSAPNSQHSPYEPLPAANAGRPRSWRCAKLTTARGTRAKLAAMKHFKPKEAWRFLSETPSAVFIDCRSEMEFYFVGHPVGAQHVAWNDGPRLGGQSALRRAGEESREHEPADRAHLPQRASLARCRRRAREGRIRRHLPRAGRLRRPARRKASPRNALGVAPRGLPWEQS